MTTWLLLRGLTREAGHWGAFPARLAAHCPGDAVMMLDLPGNGARHRERSPADVGAMAQDVRAALRAAGRPGPVGVVAMSLGAMVAAAWAARHPGELAQAVLINTSLRPFSPWHQRLRPSAWPLLLRAAFSGDAAARERAVWTLTSRGPASARGPCVEAWVALHGRHPVSRANALRQLAAAARYVSPREAPAVPVLLLRGAGDRLVDPRCSLALAAAWQAPLRTHPDAGHDLPLDDPDWVAAEVARWAARP